MSDKFMARLKEFVEVVGLRKSLEDKLVDPSGRREFRNQKRKFTGIDPLEGQITSVPGVSDVGIEARRGDTRIPKEQVVAHGYARSRLDPEQHKKMAKDIHRALLASFKEQPKPDLPKSEQGTEDLAKKEKVLIRPDVVSKPELFNEDKRVTRPAALSGPYMMNMRKHLDKFFEQVGSGGISKNKRR
jgi:hypothetical protein